MKYEDQQAHVAVSNTIDILQLPRHDVPLVTGIYFLIKDEKVVYVGQSVDIFTRVCAHRAKDFDSFTFLVYPRHLLNLAEASYIQRFNPAMNGSLPQQNFFFSLAQLKRHLGWDMRKVKRHIRENGIPTRRRGNTLYCVAADFLNMIKEDDDD